VDITKERKNQRYLRKIKDFYELIFDVTILILEVGWEEEYYQALLERLVSIITDAQAGSCLIRKGDRFEYIAAVGYNLDLLKKVTFPKDEVEVYSEEVRIILAKSLYMDLKSKDQSKLDILVQAANGKVIKSILVIPLRLGEELMGVIYIDNFEKESAFSEDIGLAHLFSKHIQLVLWKQKMEEKLKHLATHDSLTGVLNRKAFMDIADRILRLSKRYNKNFAVLYIDLDNFKMVNDTYGHDIGDKVLIEFCEKIQKVIRESDLFAKFGGDEFVILLPETDKIGAMNFAERLRAAFRKPIVVANKEIKIGFSIGISVYPEDGENLEKLVNIADERMYIDKRNRKSGSLR